MLRITTLLVSILFGTVIALYSFHHVGLRRIHHPRPHPFSSERLKVIVLNGGSGERPGDTIEAIEKSIELLPDAILHTSVWLTTDKVLVSHPQEYLEDQTNGIGSIRRKTWDELRVLDAGYNYSVDQGTPFRDRGLRIQKLEDILIRFPSQKFVIDLRDIDPQAVSELGELVGRLGREQDLLFTGVDSRITRDIRSKHPGWFSASTIDELLRSSVMASAFLETIDSMDADIFFLGHTKELSFADTPKRLLGEFRRRGKTVFAGVDHEGINIPELKAQGIRGVLTAYPSRISSNASFSSYVPATSK